MEWLRYWPYPVMAVGLVALAVWSALPLIISRIWIPWSHDPGARVILREGGTGPEGDAETRRRKEVEAIRDMMSAPARVVVPHKAPGRAAARKATTVAPSAHMPALISLVVLCAALYVVLSRAYGDSEQKWAYGAIGTVVGY